eukprot:1245599-Ditylum_brightwellii.AAC.1
MRVKPINYSEKNPWPRAEYLGDCLHAMVVCRGGKGSGDRIYQKWMQLKEAFDIKQGHGRLKNNF